MARSRPFVLLDDAGLAKLSRLPATAVLREWRLILTETKATTQRVARDTDDSWEGIVTPLSQAHERLERAWGRISHLSTVMDTPSCRRIMKRGEVWLTAYSNWFSQHRVLAQKFQRLRAQSGLTSAERRLLDLFIRDFRLGGAYATPAAQRRIRAIRLRLIRLSTEFSERLLDSTAAGFVFATTPTEVRGIPESLLRVASQRAKQQHRPGWIFGLATPEYVSVMQTAEHRGLRRRMYIAGVTRASEFGPAKHDNTPVVARILQQRQALAQALHFPTYAHLSLSRKMALIPTRAERFLRRLITPAQRQAKREFAALQRYARTSLGIAHFRPWDMEFASEQFRRQRFGFTHESLRPFFPMSAVTAVLWQTAERVLGIRVRPAKHFSGYRPDLRAFDIRDRRGAAMGRIIFDHFVRPEKRQGFWQHTDTARGRMAGRQQLPVAYIVGNFPRPNRRGESYLNHREVETLFHELGHALHTILTEVDLPGLAGTNGVEWDAVELPSQWFEQFAWEPSVFQAIARRAGKRFSAEQLRALERSRTFHGGLWVTRQLVLGLFDLGLHSVRRPTQHTAQQVWVGTYRQISVVPRISQSRMANCFSHLFDGAYAAGYYSYLWAEVLAADAFALFAARPQKWAIYGRRFRQAVLAVGGTKPPAAAYRTFRGRDAAATALNKRYGLRAS